MTVRRWLIERLYYLAYGPIATAQGVVVSLTLGYVRPSWVLSWARRLARSRSRWRS